jgi:enterochelin esterase-like enzyme
MSLGLFKYKMRRGFAKKNVVYRFLQSQFPYIDATRTAIWGWSYGGYSTGMALAKDMSGVFRCGISVAPVTDWVYYGELHLIKLNTHLK